MLVSSLSTCHMLWYLHLCAEARLVVLEYVDEASGVMAETSDGGGRFTDVLLRPQVVLAADGDSIALSNSMSARITCASSLIP